jgi:hypothetical protein
MPFLAPCSRTPSAYFLPVIWEITFHNRAKQRTILWLCICNLHVLYKKGESYKLNCSWHVFHICNPKLWEHTQIDGYKLSRAVRIAEIAFSILSQKAGIFYDQNQPSSENTDSVILSGHVLHNYLGNICNVQGNVFVDNNDTWQSPYVTICCP